MNLTLVLQTVQNNWLEHVVDTSLTCLLMPRIITSYFLLHGVH